MIDERYSIVFDYLTKGGKPTILQAPPVIMQAAGGSAAGGVAEGVASAVIIGVISALTGGLLKGFSRSKSLAIPKSNTAHAMTMKRNPFEVKETPKISIPVRRTPQAPQQRIPETARQQSDATNDAYNKGQSDSVAALLKRNEEARKRLMAQRDEALKNEAIVTKLHKEAVMKSLNSPAGQRKLEQYKQHADSISLKQITEASSKVDYKLPPATIQTPVQPVQQVSMQRAAEPLTPYDNSKSNTVIQKQTGLNEVTP
jgi:hypothetical protein